MAYKFSYQKILDVRQIQEDQKSSEFTSAKNELKIEKEKLSKLEKEKSTVMKNNVNNSQSSLDLLRKNSFMNKVNENIDKQKVRVIKKERTLSNKKSELLEASKSKKIMDKLKESDLKKYKNEQNKNEQNQIDEISANIALKNKRNK
tara:strand:+ start:137 stop:577 length:441 start_codon:yes stop_codon:yes gene_type:complete